MSHSEYAFVDGHASYLQPVEHIDAASQPGTAEFWRWKARTATRWSPNPRISPFNPDLPPARQGGRR